MASIKGSSVFNFPRNDELGFRMPQSNLQFSWRNDPSVVWCRKYVREAIQSYLAQKPREFGQHIPEVAACLENELFRDALSQEEFMDKETFHARLRLKLNQNPLEVRSAQKESMPTTLLFPVYDMDPLRGIRSDFSANSNKPLFDYITSGNTCNNLVSAGYLDQSNIYADVPRSPLLSGSKRTFDSSLQHRELVMPNILSPGEGFSCGEPADSGPTFSGSVLQYDSEASFESHHIKSQPSAEGELSAIIACNHSSPSVQTTSMVRENSKYEALTVSDEMQLQQPVFGLSQFERQLSQPKLQFMEHSHGKFDSFGRNSVQNKRSYGSYEASSLFLHGAAQPSTSSDSHLSSVYELLSWYIAYNGHNYRSGGNKIPFLEYLHSQKCKSGMCRCEEYKLLLSHFDNCGSAGCDICGPAMRTSSAGLTQPRNTRNSEDLMNPAKFRKLNSFSSRHASSCGVSVLTEDSISQQQSGFPVVDTLEINMEVVNSDANNPTKICEAGNNADNCMQGSIDLSADSKQEIKPATPCELKVKVADSCCSLPSDCAPTLCKQKCVAQNEEIMTGSDLEETKPEISGEGFQPTVEKSEKQKVDGISLTDFFTAEDIRQHISSLRQKLDQSTVEEVLENAASCPVSENFCQICALDRLAFPPMPIYCSSCGMRIKNRGTYYSTKDENRAQICFCSACHNKARGGNITFSGLSIPKINLVMKKNNLVTEESWVQCDKCEGWQHQICALFNDKRDLGGKAEYICPKCSLEDLEAEIRMPLPRSTAFDASNLPQTLLSDHIQQRLCRRLKQEREDRAKAAGKTFDEVPEPADLFVRVVSSVDKRLKVRQQFLDIFPEKNYPAEFPYRSKVILLFQRIEGVDVCLFAMYVQEYGSECSQPNQRCVYISYLDSVKYFRPEIKAASGEALRTFVYHEILVGYLDYCKKRGFATCYIWACPPVKGEDYILYCHPETQKTPRPDKLRQWYQSMLKKASKENVVVNFTNLYEKFFVPTGECNTKVTAARLPYFDGDYWSTVAETMIKKIEQEDMPMKVKKMTRRSLKAMGHINPSVDEVKDILLMQELAHSISSAKEDFIIVYLQYVCTHCHEVILSGKRWFCSQCKNYQLCQRCHDTDPNCCDQEDTHISSSGQKHALTEEVVNDVPLDTEDSDAIMDNCFLENRHAFLSFCQGNHYQFDSLRRAKHSSMMILYHLHNPNGPNIGTFCSLCLKDVEDHPKWKCEICPEFNVCDTCYQRSNASCHNHSLTHHLPKATNSSETKMVKMVKELLNVVLHASRCQTTSHSCSYPNCTLVRRLFSHARTCNIRVAGGCRYCKKTWFILMMHSRRCKELNCGVPRCMDLKKYAETLELQSKTLQNSVAPDICTQAVAIN